jgi:hypothetical protein
MQQHISISISDDDPDVAYVTLPGHPGQGASRAVKRQIRLLDIMKYEGADIYLSMDDEGRLIGIEILA